MSTAAEPSRNPFTLGTFPKVTQGRLTILKRLSPKGETLYYVSIVQGSLQSVLNDSHAYPTNGRDEDSAEGKSYVMKDMIPGEFEYQMNLQTQLSSCPNVRSVVDSIQ